MNYVLEQMPAADSAQLHSWMETALEMFLGYKVLVPKPPVVSLDGVGLLRKFRLRPLFLPALSEEQMEALPIPLQWGRYLRFQERVFRRPQKLPGKWAAFEAIPAFNPHAGRCLDDALMEEIGVNSRFDHPFSNLPFELDGGDVLAGILPKAAGVLAPLRGELMLQSADEYNFVGNFFNFVREATGESLPDLANEFSREWCRNVTDNYYALTVGGRDVGGLRAVNLAVRSVRWNNVSFRFLIVFP